ncbi:PREDICTED: IQ domain-containing protein E [Miniopterus natalensis]|uniref:IQ domain-containing protein E n=1 Tax=Miniopterus natalensis TaxID=291302 RepID=UPI0007A6A92E|nr:PREDICTED: IQ domain-containing protein E [Miniopterus natalensis]
MPLGNRMSLTPQKLWLGSSKQGGVAHPPKPGLTLEHAWTHPPSSTPDYLTEALRVKRSDLRRSASSGHVPGTPVYREKEEMYDEIMGLKKLLHMQKSDLDLLRTKLRRLEEENGRKDRQIEQLLDPTRGPDFVWTLGEKRPDAGWVINGLKQRVLRLEQQCKDKDSTISKLQADMKTTSLEEMRIIMETYYEEIHRLQTLLASSEPTGRTRPVVEKRAGLRRQKKLSSALLSLSRSVQELTEENQSLKEDLDRVLSSSPTVSRTKGYMEWSKARLLRRIAELEKKISSVESPEPQALDVVRSDPLALPASSAWAHRQPQPECQEDNKRHEDSERLRGTVRSLKGERKALQAQLQERSLEVKQLLQTKADLERELEEVREGEEARRAREEALREEVQALTTKCQDLEAVRKGEGDDPTEVTPEAPEEPRPARPASSPSQQDSEPDASEEGSPRPPCTCSEEHRHAAARVLQARWKVYRLQKRKAVLDEAATVLQAAFRGHLARESLLSSRARRSASPSVPGLPSQNPPSPRAPSPTVQAEGDPGQEEAITVIQSVFRAHMARVGHSQRPHTAAPTKTTAASGTCGTPSPPGLPVAPAGQEEGEVSSGDAREGPAPQPCPAEPPPSEPPPSASPRWEDAYSDDSDEVVVAPTPPLKKSAPLPLALSPYGCVPRGDALSAEG